VKFAVVNIDGFEMGKILSQALDLVEDVENDIIFITQSTFQNNEGILHVFIYLFIFNSTFICLFIFIIYLFISIAHTLNCNLCVLIFYVYFGVCSE
jgi:hypothetical protein